MPITGPIPLPETGMDAFLNEMQRGKENQYREALSQQAQANAQRAQVISQLLKNALSGGEVGGGGKQGGTGGQSNSGMDMLYRLGILKPTPQELANIQQNTKAQEAVNKTTLENAYAQLPLNASFNALDSIFKDPEYRNFAGTPSSQLMSSAPRGFPLGTMLQRNLPSKFPSSAARKIAAANTHMGNIVVGVADKLKGPFKDLSSNLINSMKPNATDSIDVQESKVRQLRLLSDLGDRQNELISKLSKTMNPTEAVVESTRQLMPEFQQIVSENVSSGGEQPQQSEEAPAAMPTNQQSPQGYSSQNLSNQATASGEGMANVAAPTEQPQVGKPDDMVYLVVKTKNGSRKVKMKRVFAEAIKSGKMKYE